MFSFSLPPLKFTLIDICVETCICQSVQLLLDFPGGSDSKSSAYNAGDPSSISGLGRSHEEGYGNPLWYSCLENPMDRGAWWAVVHGSQGVTHSWATNTFTFFHEDEELSSLYLFCNLKVMETSVMNSNNQTCWILQQRFHYQDMQSFQRDLCHEVSCDSALTT